MVEMTIDMDSPDCLRFRSKTLALVVLLSILPCLASSRASQEGFYVDCGIAQPWEELYRTMDQCCSHALWWKEDCEYQMGHTATPTNKPTRKPSKKLSSKTHRRPKKTSKKLTSKPHRHPKAKASQNPEWLMSRHRVVQICPVANAVIRESQPNENFGRRTVLKVNSSNWSQELIIEFDLVTSIGTLDASNVISATLSLYSLCYSHRGVNIQLFVPTLAKFARRDDWDENTTTWNSMKSILSRTENLGRMKNLRSGRWHSVDVTDAIGIDRFVTFVVRHKRSSRSDLLAAFASKDGLNHLAPILTLTLK